MNHKTLNNNLDLLAKECYCFEKWEHDDML